MLRLQSHILSMACAAGALLLASGRTGGAGGLAGRGDVYVSERQ